MRITFQCFCDLSLDSLSWYDLLRLHPYVCIENLPAEFSYSLIVLPLLSFANSSPPSALNIDLAAAYAFNGALNSLPLEQLSTLSYNSSAQMSSNLSLVGSRSYRMRAQRLNYILQIIISEKIQASPPADSLLGDKILPYCKPWDFLFHGSCQWYLSSGTPSLHLCSSGCTQSFAADRPTQLSIYQASVILGSIYTGGYGKVTEGSFRWISLSDPVLLLFDYNGITCALTHTGKIIDADSGKFMLFTGVHLVHFARLFDGCLYLLSNSCFGHIYSFKLSTLRLLKISIFPVLVCNDMCLVDGFWYLIDKQQGSVFKFDTCFQYVSSVLGFGYGPFQLADPVAIHHYNGSLHILSWLSSRLTSIALF